MLLEIVLCLGLLGAVLMFIGDMALYYTKEDPSSNGSLQPLIDVMKTIRPKRLYLGGMLGPIAAFFYCIGYYHLVLFLDETYAVAGWCCFFVNCLGIICGGAFHSHYPYYGLLGRLAHDDVIEEMRKYMSIQQFLSFGLQGVGFLALAVFIAAGWTSFPRWMLLFSPGILFLGAPLAKKLPKGVRIVFAGGWTNWISIIYYAMALAVTVIP